MKKTSGGKILILHSCNLGFIFTALMQSSSKSRIEKFKKEFSGKFISEERIFSKINRGNRIFVATGCGEPQYLVRALVKYVESHPKTVFDAEVFHVWSLDIAPYTDKKFKSNFRHNSFFIGNNTRDVINAGAADYTPVFLSQLPSLLRQKYIPIDVALIQVSPPDEQGYVNFGISLDITRAAAEAADIVIAQINTHMPRIHGSGFIHMKDIDYFVHHDEPLLEYHPEIPNDISSKIGNYVARIIQDGDTLQVGYGSIPNAILAGLTNKKHLGIHTELLTDGIVDLIRKGVVDNSQKQINPGKTVATFCMGRKETYDYVNDHPAFEFRGIDYTNNPLNIAQIDNMVAINSGMEVDLTGQSTAESIGKTFYSGIGGQADFMRGAVLSKGGRTILALSSTTADAEISKIVPFLKEGAGVTLNRGDIHYVITEYGIAYLHGKSIRERAMELISISHPKFRPWLIEEAKNLNLIYKDQAFIPGKKGEYPEHLETFKSTKTGLRLFLRPVKISDEPLLKDFFYSLSDDSTYRRFISSRKDMPHERLQEFVIIDYTKEMVINAVISEDGKEKIIGLGQYGVDETTHTAEVAFVVRDDYHDQGIGSELLSYLTLLAKRQGLLGFTAEVLIGNHAMLRVFEKMGFDMDRRQEEGVFELKRIFGK